MQHMCASRASASVDVRVHVLCMLLKLKVYCLLARYGPFQYLMPLVIHSVGVITFNTKIRVGLQGMHDVGKCSERE